MIIVDDNRDVTSLLAARFTLNKYGTHKAYSAEGCLNKVKELDGKVNIVYVDGKIAADRAAMLIVQIKRINSNIKVMVVADDETDKTRVLDYGADEFTTKPISVETIVDKVNQLIIQGKNQEP